MMSTHTDAQQIIQSALAACLPRCSLCRALRAKNFPVAGSYLVAAGKQPGRWLNALPKCWETASPPGVVVTKYDHSKGRSPIVPSMKAGHPVPDENSFRGTRAAMDLVQNLT